MKIKGRDKIQYQLFLIPAVVLFMVFVMNGLVLPEVTKEFQVSLPKTGIVTAVQNAGGTIALALCGHLEDRFGRQRTISGCH